MSEELLRVQVQDPKEVVRDVETLPPVSLYGYDWRAASDATALDTGDETIVQQQFTEEADINVLVKRFGFATPYDSSRIPVFGDFTGITDFASAREAIARAEEQFMSLPAAVRERFANDPAQLIEFAREEGSAEKFVEMLKPALPAGAPAAGVLSGGVVPPPPAADDMK